MIEAGFILVVLLVSALIYLGARVQAAQSRLSPAEERQHLEQRIAWHEDQLRLAREKNWDAVMVGHIADQLADNRRQLARLTGQENAG